MSNVIIVGAGPAGLALAAELASFGISCRIFEQRDDSCLHSRAFSLFSHTLELLDMRGRAEKMIENGLPITISPLGDGKNCLNLKQIDSKFSYILSIPQTKTEEILEEFAKSSGAEVILNTKVIALSQDDTKVTVRLEKEGNIWSENAAFVVGCDGARSTIRKLLNIQFEGVSYDNSLMHGDVYLRNPRIPSTYARTNQYGTAAVFPFKNGTFRMLLLDHTRMHISTDEQITLEEFKESANRLLGMDLGIYDPLWFSRFTCQQRHAKQYRIGRVLLSGDAAHTFLPAGGQGLQIGIQDAHNLGWKLASEINGDAPPGLLDSYEFERRQIATLSMKKSILLFKYEISQSILAKLGRWLANRIVVLFPVKKLIMNELFGLRTCYKPHNSLKAHKLVGHRASDVDIISVIDGKKIEISLHKLLRKRKFILIDQSIDFKFINSIGYEYENKIIGSIPLKKLKKLPNAFLVRPDGFIAWASKSRDTPIEFKNELKNWIKQSS